MLVEFFELAPTALLVFAGLFGLMIGSFLNVVIYRLPRMLEREWREQCEALASEPSTLPDSAGDGAFNLWHPRSACPSCGTKIAAYDNVPILSYTWLRGRCRHCGNSISARYPLIEAIAGILAVVVAWEFGPSWQLLAGVAITWTLLALAVIDIGRYFLPDSMTLPLMWAGLIASTLTFDGQPLFVGVQASVIGAAAGYLSLWSVYQLFKLVTGKEGMGYGDFKLLAALGAWLGWQQLPLVIVLSAFVGAVVGGALLFARGHERQTPIPFGPYLAAAGWIALLWGDALNRLYFDTFF